MYYWSNLFWLSLINNSFLRQFNFEIKKKSEDLSMFQIEQTRRFSSIYFHFSPRSTTSTVDSFREQTNTFLFSITNTHYKIIDAQLFQFPIGNWSIDRFHGRLNSSVIFHFPFQFFLFYPNKIKTLTYSYLE